MDEQNGINLTAGGLKKLGNLVDLKDKIISDAIRERGGGQGQVNQLRSDYQNLRVGELANLAAAGDEDAETAIKILQQARKNGKNMETDELPIGQSLIAVSIVEDQEFHSNELVLSQIDLFFPDTKITLLPIADTDEIEIVQQADSTCTIDTPWWCQDLITEKLMAVWICDNHQDYRDQVIFAFNSLHPSLTFVAEGSVLKVFRYQQIYQHRNNEFAQALLNSQPAVADTFKATMYTQVLVNNKDSGLQEDK